MSSMNSKIELKIGEVTLKVEKLLSSVEVLNSNDVSLFKNYDVYVIKYNELIKNFVRIKDNPCDACLLRNRLHILKGGERFNCKNFECFDSVLTDKPTLSSLTTKNKARLTSFNDSVLDVIDAADIICKDICIYSCDNYKLYRSNESTCPLIMLYPHEL